MSDLLSLGLSGLRAYRTALGAVGENVANAETDGYTRRKVNLTPGVTGGARLTPYYADNFVFGGVAVQGVERAWDMFKASEMRHATSAAGRTGVREQWLTGIETALDDGPFGVGSKITAFFNAADDLAATPGDTFGRSQFLAKLDEVASSFRTNAEALGRLSTGMADSAGIEIDGLNNAISALSELNAALRTASPGGAVRAAIEDDRDRLINSIAERIGIVASTNPDGTAQLTLADPPGTLLVSPTETSSFALTVAADGRLSLQVTNSTGPAAVVPSSGKLAGLIESADAAASRLTDLNMLALDFTTQLNTWSAAGFDPAGNPGADLLEAPGGAATMRGLVTNPSLVPAARGGAANGNLLALDALRGPGGVERRWTNLVAGHAQTLASAKSEHAAASAWRDNSFGALDEVTGIDLDREAADLLRFQQAYSAAARIIQVGRETVQDILNIF
ncbi:MAG TPA: flagellar hook-associated protein FlgK [Allosphingosinicella sp.]